MILRWGRVSGFYRDIFSRSLTWNLIEGKSHVYQAAYLPQAWFCDPMASVEARSSCLSPVQIILSSLCIFPVFWSTRWQIFPSSRVYGYYLFWLEFLSLLLIRLGYHNPYDHPAAELCITLKILGLQQKRFVYWPNQSEGSVVLAMISLG